MNGAVKNSKNPKFGTIKFRRRFLNEIFCGISLTFSESDFFEKGVFTALFAKHCYFSL